ncbi:gamma-glutamyltranspeptidase [Nakamurella sp. YIM 132087]|uniref:Gamma-glutamyltranspeptidase n=1 Tax=Nakamurella alba TaxID=2665158 RepID=A0A7K1FLH5_9ACTN|nr:gamma-glutamyltranspeptidase [Nakamurella alba]
MQPVPAGVAAGHPATASVGADVLRRGGNAADAAAAMVLAGCVAETIFTGLGGGGFATVYTAADRSVHCLDFFVSVPGLDGTIPAPARDIEVVFGDVPVPYAVGGPSVAVPGTPSGVAALHHRFGNLPWAEIVTPARDLATIGVPFSVAHAELLPEVRAAMVLGDGVHSYTRPDGSGDRRLLAAGEDLLHPGLAETLDAYLTGGPEVFTHGGAGAALVTAVRADGGALSADDLTAYRVADLPVATAAVGDAVVHVRGNDLDHFAGTLAALSAAEIRAGGPRRAAALVSALRAPLQRTETTSVVAVDRYGNACAATHSLGLGSGIWVSGVHGNSMLGEGELLRGDLHPGLRMPSMMVPHVVTDRDGRLVAAGGAAGGSRIRSALVQVLSGMLLEGLSTADAVAAPRLAVGPGVVHLEPGFPAGTAGALRAAGDAVVEWDAAKPYFGGAAMIGADGPAADPRRGGLAVLV